MKNLKSLIIGIFAGFVTGFFSTGGGMVILPAIIYFFKIDEKKARATTIFTILPMVITAGIFYYKDNFFDINLGIKCARILKKVSNKYLKVIFIFFLLYASFNMLR